MTMDEFEKSLVVDGPPEGLSAPLSALWWDAKGNRQRAHAMVDELETKDGMAVHAYLHRKEGSETNANYWYDRAGRTYQRPTLQLEWQVLVQALLPQTEKWPG